jgi:ABC-type dipeptide/oligopeptide/nickel transport system permease component
VLPPPRHQLRHVVAGDFGQEFMPAKMVKQHIKLSPCIVGTGMVLAYLVPIATGYAIKIKTKRDGTGLFEILPCALALYPLRLFGLAFASLFRSAVKPMASQLKVVLIERRVFSAIDRHDDAAPALRCPLVSLKSSMAVSSSR